VPGVDWGLGWGGWLRRRREEENGARPFGLTTARGGNLAHSPPATLSKKRSLLRSKVNESKERTVPDHRPADKAAVAAPSRQSFPSPGGNRGTCHHRQGDEEEKARTTEGKKGGG